MAYRTSAEFETGNPNNQEFENALERLRAVKEANISATSMTRYLIAQVKRVLIDEAQRQERYRHHSCQPFPLLYLNYLERSLVHSAMPRVKVYFESSGIRFTQNQDSYTILY